MCHYVVEPNRRHSFAFPSSFASCAKNTEEHNKIFPTFAMFILILLAALKPWFMLKWNQKGKHSHHALGWQLVSFPKPLITSLCPMGRLNHGKLQGPCAPRKPLPGVWDLVDGEALALVRHPQEQEHRLQPAGQQGFAAPPGDHRKCHNALFLDCWWVDFVFFHECSTLWFKGPVLYPFL